MPRPKTSGERRVTMADVAALAQCSQSTVSAVLNPDSRIKISNETRERIFKAVAELGYHLEDWSGSGWDDVVRAHRDRAIVLQGRGDCPGKGTYRGPHAAIWLPDGAWGDPLTNRWQRVDQGAIRRWAEAWNPSISFAVTRRRAA